MGFSLPDLVIESVIRDGLANIKAKPELLDDVFSEMLRAYASRKYGAAEIQKIKDLIDKENIAVVHSFHEASAKSPCFSIQLGSDGENQRHDVLDDFIEQRSITITDPDQLDDLVKVDNLIPASYNPIDGMVKVDDSVDLSEVYTKFLYTDGSGTIFEVRSGISNETGDKYFFIEPNLNPDIVNPGSITSFLAFEDFEIKAIVNQCDLMLGVHTKEALLTKYLYILLKYILESRKKDLIRRGFANMVLRGSDFTRDFQYQGDIVFTRFLTVSGRTEDIWRSDKVDLIDHVETDPSAIE